MRRSPELAVGRSTFARDSICARPSDLTDDLLPSPAVAAAGAHRQSLVRRRTNAVHVSRCHSPEAHAMSSKSNASLFLTATGVSRAIPVTRPRRSRCRPARRLHAGAIGIRLFFTSSSSSQPRCLCSRSCLSPSRARAGIPEAVEQPRGRQPYPLDGRRPRTGTDCRIGATPSHSRSRQPRPPSRK